MNTHRIVELWTAERRKKTWASLNEIHFLASSLFTYFFCALTFFFSRHRHPLTTTTTHYANCPWWRPKKVPYWVHTHTHKDWRLQRRECHLSVGGTGTQTKPNQTKKERGKGSSQSAGAVYLVRETNCFWYVCVCVKQVNFALLVWLFDDRCWRRQLKNLYFLFNVTFVLFTFFNC